MLQARTTSVRDAQGQRRTRCAAFSTATTPRQIARTRRVARANTRINAKGIGGWIENVLSSFDFGDRESDKCEEDEDETANRSAPDIEHGIMLQGFGWASCRKGGWYNTIKSKVPDIQKLGVTFVWLPPPSQSVSCEGYMPGQLYDLNTPYGKETELRGLIKDMKRAGMFPLADIVINHRCADIQDSNGIWNTFSDKVKHPGKSIAWGKWAIVGGDGYGGTGGGDTGADFGPAPDLDHNNKEVHESLRDWLAWLHKNVGFYGWRLDYVKGYSAKWVKYYIENSVGASAFNVGEYWSDMAWGSEGLEFHQDGARQVLCDYIDACGGEVAMFDFPTKGILQEAVRHTQYHRLRDGAGKPPGLLGWWSSKAVTFVDNHDTGSTQNHWPFPKDKIMTGYAYILTHPGMPCLQWEHVFDDGYYKPILQLVRLRRRNKINIRSKIFIECADHDMYVAHIDNSVIVKLGPRYDMGHHLPRKADGWKLAASGVDFAVWDKFGMEEAKEA